MRGRARIHDRMGRAREPRPQPARPPRTPAHAWSSWREIGPAFPCSGRPSHCKALTSAAAPSRCARSACPVNPSFTLNTTTPAQRIFCSARPLGCVSATQCRSERPTALLLLAPEDNLWNDLALPQRKKPPFCTSPPRSSVRVRSHRRPLRHPLLRHRGCLNPRHRWRCRLRLREAIPRHLPRHLRHPHHQSNPRSCTPAPRSHNR